MKTIEFRSFPALNFEVTEALNTLCTNLSFSGAGVKRIMITSSHEGEGKSFISLNILALMSTFGYKVAFVDADLRNSNIVQRYDGHVIDPDAPDKIPLFQNGRRSKNGIPGLAHFLAGTAEIEDILSKTNLGTGFMIPVGRLIPNPLPLLNTKRFFYLMDALSETMDYVFVDAPPLGPVVDALQIANACDAVLIVVKHNDVRRQELIDVRNQLSNIGCPILGCVINQVNYKSILSRRYYSHYYHARYDHGKSGYADKK